MKNCPVCGKEVQEKTTKCYSCRSEFTYGKKGRIKYIKRSEDIINERRMEIEKKRYESLPKKVCITCGNTVREGEYYCQLCGEEDAYNSGSTYFEE